MARECSTHESDEKYVELSSKNLKAGWENTLGRRLTTDFRSDWQVVSRSGRMSPIYLLTAFSKLSNLFIVFIIYF
jgi:hypothetical protein